MLDSNNFKPLNVCKEMDDIKKNYCCYIALL